jgi:hypothetical protein
MNKLASMIALGLPRAVQPDPGRTRPHAATAAVFALCLASALSGCGPKQTQSTAETAPASSATPVVNQEAEKPVVEPEAVAALQRMSAYLQTLDGFDLTTNSSLDLVNDHGERLTLGGSAHYKFRRPNGFVIDVKTDYKNRRFYYDGKQFTIYAPDFGFYAQAPAPATVRETLDELSTKYGVTLPLEDLFLWADPANKRVESLTSAFLVGTATVDGADTDHYAFREGEKDWQLWIQQGDKPFPRKLVIIDHTDPANPTFDARLTWKPGAIPTSDQFVFKPAKDDKHIRLASAGN